MLEVGGGDPPSIYLEDSIAFSNLIAEKSMKLESTPVPNFVKKLDEVPIIELPLQHPIHIVVSMADRALVDQFTGLWPCPNTTNN